MAEPGRSPLRGEVISSFPQQPRRCVRDFDASVDACARCAAPRRRCVELDRARHWRAKSRHSSPPGVAAPFSSSSTSRLQPSTVAESPRPRSRRRGHGAPTARQVLGDRPQLYFSTRLPRPPSDKRESRARGTVASFFGSPASMLGSSPPILRGTLKSTRIKTRLPSVESLWKAWHGDMMSAD